MKNVPLHECFTQNNIHVVIPSQGCHNYTAVLTETQCVYLTWLKPKFSRQIQSVSAKCELTGWAPDTQNQKGINYFSYVMFPSQTGSRRGEAGVHRWNVPINKVEFIQTLPKLQHIKYKQLSREWMCVACARWMQREARATFKPEHAAQCFVPFVRDEWNASLKGCVQSPVGVEACAPSFGGCARKVILSHSNAYINHSTLLKIIMFSEAGEAKGCF